VPTLPCCLLSMSQGTKTAAIAHYREALRCFAEGIGWGRRPFAPLSVPEYYSRIYVIQ
jgi:hypothetical protein